jgi:hypothetical protein
MSAQSKAAGSRRRRRSRAGASGGHGVEGLTVIILSVAVFVNASGTPTVTEPAEEAVTRHNIQQQSVRVTTSGTNETEERSNGVGHGGGERKRGRARVEDTNRANRDGGRRGHSSTNTSDGGRGRQERGGGRGSERRRGDDSVAGSRNDVGHADDGQLDSGDGRGGSVAARSAPERARSDGVSSETGAPSATSRDRGGDRDAGGRGCFFPRRVRQNPP